MPAVNRVPAVHGADAIEPPPAYQPVAFQHFPANRPVLPMDKRNKFLTFREWREGERESGRGGGRGCRSGWLRMVWKFS
jgi:hypothetical protein